ncbi:MAG: response regulator transcription factor [Pseudomonadota bacterium]
MIVLIADTQGMLRDTLKAFLEQQADIEVALAASLEEAMVQVARRDDFDLVLLDDGMPGMEGLVGLDKALALAVGMPVALMSSAAPKAVAREALDRGAAGFLPKALSATSFVNAIRFMAAGEQFAPPDMLTSSDSSEHRLKQSLSERETQVLKALTRGLSNKEIARDLDLQEATVKLHMKTLCRKIEARNRTHAAMIAKEAELL